LRARHLPFPIGSKERDEWLTCMLLAMRDLGYGEKKEDLLLEAFFGTADWMKNKAG
jgi:hemoglobin